MTTRPYPSYWMYRDGRGEWRWRYDAKNAETLAVSSEGYVRRSDCRHAISLMQASASSPIWVPNIDAQAA